MTEELFRDDATLLRCQAKLSAVGEIGIELDCSVFYPLGGGQAGDSGWLMDIDGVDLQPCGGTHVASTAQIGAVTVTKIEKKSAKIRRGAPGHKAALAC